MSALKLRLIVTAIAVLSGTTYASDADEDTDGNDLFVMG